MPWGTYVEKTTSHQQTSFKQMDILVASVLVVALALNDKMLAIELTLQERVVNEHAYVHHTPGMAPLYSISFSPWDQSQ